jgi:hypothetical protein
MGYLLVVDYEKTIRVCLAEILENYGHKVVIAENGAQAIGLFKKMRGEISLLIMDIAIPGLSGVDTITAIRELDPFIKIVLMSGGPHSDLMELKVGAFIRKPFKSKDFHGVVLNMLRNESSAPWAGQC